MKLHWQHFLTLPKHDFFTYWCHLLDVVTHLHDVVTSLNNVDHLKNLLTFAWYIRSLVVFMLPDWSWYLLVHFQVQCLQTLMNMCCFLGGWPPNSRQSAILRHISYLWLGSSYQRDLGVYFHILEVEDHNKDRTKTAKLTIDLQIQGHTLFCVTFHISGEVRAIRDLGVYISTWLKSWITINDIINTALFTVDFQIQGHALFCVTFVIYGWVRAIRKMWVYRLIVSRLVYLLCVPGSVPMCR